MVTAAIPAPHAAVSTPVTLTPPKGREQATICTVDGLPIARGTLEFGPGASLWSGTVHHLDRPGQIASAYFGAGVREVVVRLSDGRSARAHITSTSFLAGAQRVCQLDGRSAFS